MCFAALSPGRVKQVPDVVQRSAHRQQRNGKDILHVAEFLQNYFSAENKHTNNV